jgi:hypothetical protein
MAGKNGAAPKPPPGMTEFDGLMKKLVQVPKYELDAAVKKHGKLARARRGRRKPAK